MGIVFVDKECYRIKDFVQNIERVINIPMVKSLAFWQIGHVQEKKKNAA